MVAGIICPICGQAGTLYKRPYSVGAERLWTRYFVTGNKFSYSCGSCGRQGRTYQGGFTAANGHFVSDADAIASAAADFETVF